MPAPSQACSRLPITTVIVCCNECRHLPACIAGVSFCDELIVIDLRSTDGCPELVASLGATIRHHPRVPFGQLALPSVLGQLRNPWVLNVDPDEVVPADLVPRIAATLAAGTADVGTIGLPYQFYFGRRPLRGTIWGGTRPLYKLFHADRITIGDHPHDGVMLRPGYRRAPLENAESCPVQHYWMENWSQLFEKHLRYIQQEGVARHAAGERFGWKKASVTSARAFKRCLIDCIRYRDGVAGVLLSVFYGWYTWNCFMSLRAQGKG
ncbi:MAG TPA: glycosyltransferase [Tepidisphaeraceae bacterium]|jgi:hypothetical protein